MLLVTTGQSDVRQLCKLKRPELQATTNVLEQRATGSTGLEEVQTCVSVSPEEMVDNVRKV